MKHSSPHRTLFASLAGLWFGGLTLYAIDTEKLTVNATVITAPIPSVSFTWDTQAASGTVQILRRDLGKAGATGSNAFTTVGTVSHPTANYTDTTVTNGAAYE